jgi:hypothetical protein
MRLSAHQTTQHDAYLLDTLDAMRHVIQKVERQSHFTNGLSSGTEQQF